MYKKAYDDYTIRSVKVVSICVNWGKACSSAAKLVIISPSYDMVDIATWYSLFQYIVYNNNGL